MATLVDEYMEAFMSGVDSGDDSPEENSALDKMDALWPQLSDAEREQVKGILAAKVKERAAGLQEQITRHETAKTRTGQA